MEERFSNAYVGEKLILTFDYTDELAVGESLAGTPTVDVKVTLGTDATPTAVLNGTPTIVGSAVLLPIDPATADVEYRFKMLTQTTNANKLLACVGKLYVEKEPA